MTRSEPGDLAGDIRLPRPAVPQRELVPGQTFLTPTRTVTEAELAAYSGLSGDFEEIHVSDTAARASGFDRRIAHGPLSLVLVNGLVVQSGILRDGDLLMLGLSGNFRRPVALEMTVQVRLRVRSWRRTASDPGRAILVLDYELFDTAGRDVLSDGTWTEMFAVTDAPLEEGSR